MNRIELSLNLQMENCGEQRNLDDFAAVSCGILQTGPRNLAKFSVENCEPYSCVICALELGILLQLQLPEGPEICICDSIRFVRMMRGFSGEAL